MNIFEASRAGDLIKIKKFLDLSFDVNAKNEKGHSVLMLSAYNGHYEASKYLIDQGADVNSVDQSSNSILMGVVYKGHTSLFELLIRSGANLSYENGKKQTSLDFAVMFGRRNIIFRINQLLNSTRPDGKIEQIKTWAKSFA